MDITKELNDYLDILDKSVDSSSKEMNKKLCNLVREMRAFCKVYDDFQSNVRKYEELKQKMGNEEGEDEE